MSVISSFPLLTQEEIQIARRLSAVLASKGYGAVNALHELLSGAPGPGGQAVLYRPHDHCLVGIPLPRSSVYSFAKANVGTWPLAITASSTWYKLDRAAGASSTIAIQTGPANLMLYVTPGIDSDSTNVGGANPCALSAKFAIYASAGTTSVRFRNLTTGSVSSSASSATTSAIVQLAVQDIPCRGGVWNEIDIEVSSTSSSTNIQIVDLNIAETRGVSQPLSSGSATLSGASKP